MHVRASQMVIFYALAKVGSFNEAGQQFYLYCEKMYHAMTEASAIMDDERDEVAGVLRLGLFQSFGTMHIIPAIAVVSCGYRQQLRLIRIR